MSRRILVFLPLLLLLLFLNYSEADDVGIIWDRTSDDASLTETCATGRYTYVIIYYFRIAYNSTVGVVLEGRCSTGCPHIVSAIRNCQKEGIKVMLSVEIDYLAAFADAKNISDYLWSNFLGGSSLSLPFDGINFDVMVDTHAAYIGDVARYLKSHASTEHPVYLSVSHDCQFPDPALLSVHFDYVSVQFFDLPICSYDHVIFDSLISVWNQWASSFKLAKVFLGLPATQAPNKIGYIPPDILVSKLLPLIKNSSNYGGVMLWSRYDDKLSAYRYSASLKIYSVCIEQSNPGCKRGNFVERFGYMSTPGIKVYDGKNIDAWCCENMCRNNCSCHAYAPTNHGNNTGCQIWGKGAEFIRSSGENAQPIYLFKHKVNRWWIWLIIGVGAALAIPVVFYLCLVLWRKYKAKVARTMMQKDLIHEIGGNAMLAMVYGKARKSKNSEKPSNEVQIFTFESMAAATNNFAAANKLGEGGFGPVYKGTLRDGQEVAIKRLSKSSGQGVTEFKNEAKLMAKLQHTNLVKILGFCIQGVERILVYEYMSNKSLDFYLFDSTRKNLLDWKKRLDIIGGIAQGLLYLHKYSRLKVIHRDLKGGNILLDEEMNPKISDFGMARIFGLRASEEKTNRVVGTYGYMSPEYAIHGVVSVKVDVFSFGVLILEILSGKKSNSRYDSNHPLSLIGFAWKLWNEGRALELADPALGELSSENEVLRCIHVGLLCVQEQAKDRPTMSDIVSFLSIDTIQLPQPKQPPFFFINEIVEEPEVPYSRQEHHSLNDVTISNMSAR